MTGLTHKQLVRRIAKWMKMTRGYPVVMAELSTAAGETPDVIAWRSGAFSVLIECKVSRGDFLSDKDKRWRAFQEAGMGNQRYYAVPKGMLRADELPDGWGLLEVDERCVREEKEAPQLESNKRNECIMLMSALRRLEISTAVYVVHEPQPDSVLVP